MGIRRQSHAVVKASNSALFWAVNNASSRVFPKERGTKSCLFLPSRIDQSFLTLSLQVLIHFHRLNRCDSWAPTVDVGNKMFFSLFRLCLP